MTKAATYLASRSIAGLALACLLAVPGAARAETAAPASTQPAPAAQPERPAYEQLAQTSKAVNDPGVAASAPATPTGPTEDVGQELTSEGEATTQIVVTGSLISGAVESAALPVAVVTQEELELQGNPTLPELFRKLPYVGPLLGESNQFAPAAQGVVGTASVNLRGLGSSRTLLLLNGRRTTQTPGPVAKGVDHNMMPQAVVGRVEILLEGGAATYGSDAIAGVVNLITRKDLEGFEAQFQYNAIDGSKGDYEGYVNWGWVGSNANVMASFGYQHRSELNMLDRDFPIQPYYVNPAGWSVLGNPSTFLPRNGATPVAGVTRDANCEAVGGYAGFTGATPACYFTYIPFDNLVEKQNRYQAYVEGNVDITDTLNLHLEGLWGYHNTPDIRFSPAYPPLQGPNGPGSSGTFTVNSSGPTPFANNPGALAALQQAGLSQATINRTNNINLTLWRPLGNGGNPTTGGLGGQSGSRDYTLWRGSGTLDWDISDNVNALFAMTYSTETANSLTTDVITNNLNLALQGLGGPNCNGIPYGSPGSSGCGFYNPFSNGYPGNPALGLTNPGFIPANANDPALVGWLFDRPTTTQKTSLFVIDGVFSGELPIWEMKGGKIGWAAGGQYRQDSYDVTTDSALNNVLLNPCPVPGTTNCTIKTGSYIFLGQAYPNSVDGSVWALFGELALPFTDTLSMQLALRYENYGKETGTTVDPKVALRWQATDWFAFRGAVQTTFRGPIPADKRVSYVTALAGIPVAGNSFKAVDVYGNPAIQPETAFSWNVGGIFTRNAFRMTVDYWSYRFEDQILNLPAVPIAAAVAGPGTGAQFVNCSSPLRPLITFSNNDTCIQGVTNANAISRIKSDLVNGPEVKITGIDIAASYSWDDVFMPDTVLSLGVDATHYFKWQQEAFTYLGAPVTPAFNAVGFTNYGRFPGTISPWRALASLNYNVSKKFNFLYQFNYIAGVTDDRLPISVQSGLNGPGTPGSLIPITYGLKVDPYYVSNFYVTLNLPRDVSLNFGITNLFDRQPSAARLEAGYDPFIGNPLGRVFEFGVKVDFF